MTIVLDSNCLIQILPRLSDHRWLYDLILDGSIRLAVTNEILSEYAEVLDTFFESETLGELITKVIIELPGTEKTIAYFHFGLIENDPDDNKFVDCAIAANTDFIITNDRHFRVLKTVPFPKVLTLTLDEFQRFWQNNANNLEEL